MSEQSAHLYTDRRHLTTAAYSSGANLRARQDIYQYQQPRIDLAAWALGQVAWRGDERVIDVGCGNGAYLRRLIQPGTRGWVLGFDLSRGMLADLARGWDIAAPPHLAAADIQALPLPGASCDVALAMHMLYHVPDIERAAHELRRVLRPGGVLLAVTNSAHHNQELFALYETAFARVAGDGAVPGERWDRRFELENGAALLQSAFAQVERRDITGALVIPEAAPVLRYLDSTHATRAPALPDGVTWEDLMAEAARIVDRTIAGEGSFRVTTHTGVFVCR